MPEYTLLTLIALAAVVAVELFWWRTGIFRTLRYWIVMVIVAMFQIPVDGYLTRLADPVVIYDNAQTSGIRWPLDIPIEDFGFGFAMVTLTILLWRRLTDRHPSAEPATAGDEAASTLDRTDHG